ncbi:hypothetical protein AXG93_4225s1060 [Marchantia polymorpha subsp. ruderalis]|uniref:Uncharacterized protein n=1 Tax=Marchantia polymorpha subsp. ruderalis TaxID=1480154 RepID=A0A176WTC9_MARPO|nr:hypothetical protein AXG93_4225s1060 [Marchantia polymorpha subsp. ruderalis]
MRSEGSFPPEESHGGVRTTGDEIQGAQKWTSRRTGEGDDYRETKAWSPMGRRGEEEKRRSNMLAINHHVGVVIWPRELPLPGSRKSARGRAIISSNYIMLGVGVRGDTSIAFIETANRHKKHANKQAAQCHRNLDRFNPETVL